MSPSATQPLPLWKAAAVLAVGIITFLAIATSCDEPPKTVTSSSTSSTSSVPSDRTISDLAAREIGALHAPWAPYVSGVTYRSGVLRVMLQTQDKDIAQQVANATRTMIRAGTARTLKENVDWVEVTDGTGTHLAQVKM